MDSEHVGMIDVESRPGVVVIVNGRPREVRGPELSFEEVVNLAYDNNPPSGPYIVITVTYSRGVGGAQGTMCPGDSVKIRERMIFNVTATDKS